MSISLVNTEAPAEFVHRMDARIQNTNTVDDHSQERRSGLVYNLFATSLGDTPEMAQPDTSVSSRGEGEEMEYVWTANDVERPATNPSERQQNAVAGEIFSPSLSHHHSRPTPSGASSVLAESALTATESEDGHLGNRLGPRSQGVFSGPAVNMLGVLPGQLRGVGREIGLAGQTGNDGSDQVGSTTRTLSQTTGGSSAPMFPNRRRRRLFGGFRGHRDSSPERPSFWTGRGVGGTLSTDGSIVAGVDNTGMGGNGGAVEGGADNSDAERSEGRILFYHKPTLANVPAGDIPDAVPVYLGCPGGGMALGLPLNEAWQGGGQQDTTFNQNLSYTILSWPERHVKDAMEIRRQQVLFLTAMVFNLLVVGFLFFSENPDRTRVEPPARVRSFPGPFEQRVGADAEAIHEAQEQHVLVAFLIGLWGMFSVLSLSGAGIALYLCSAVVNVIGGLGSSPDTLYACRYMVDIVLIVIGRSLLSTITYAWVTAAAGDRR